MQRAERGVSRAAFYCSNKSRRFASKKLRAKLEVCIANGSLLFLANLIGADLYANKSAKIDRLVPSFASSATATATAIAIATATATLEQRQQQRERRARLAHLVRFLLSIIYLHALLLHLGHADALTEQSAADGSKGRSAATSPCCGKREEQ